METVAQRVERGKALSLKLLAGCFVLSMIVTNDVALVVMVPLTLSLNVRHKDWLVIFEALAANAGSALTPFGNPQNLFIYWFYNLEAKEFIASIAPFSLAFLALLLIAAWRLKTPATEVRKPPARILRTSWIFALLLLLVLLTALRLLPLWTAAVALAVSFLFQRSAFRVDYSLLLSFFFFFGLAENLKTLLTAELAHSGHIFLFSALASQIMSNVPATLLFAKFTGNWEALLWGSNAGGFGSLFASLANLIAYRFYVSQENSTDNKVFILKFLVAGYTAFFLAIGWYFLVQNFH